jgi:putative methyltransferase (TIGR04325 family)
MTLRRAIGRYIPVRMRALLNDLGPYGYSGSFPTWDAAQAHVTSDEPDGMIERTAAATAAVRDGSAEYEQDSVFVPPPAEMAHLLTAIRDAARPARGCVHVVEFGGAFGSKYFWARRALEPSIQLRWTVVELPRHVEYGRAHFGSEALQFVDRLDAAARPVDVVACYSVIQYLPDPVDGARALARMGARTIVLDRIPYSATGTPQLVRQRVRGDIYEASLVSWLPAEREVVGAIEAAGYRATARWEYPRAYTRRAVFTSHVFARATESGPA